MITQAALKEQLRYEPDTGRFVWRKSAPGRRPDLVAGNTEPRGYMTVRIGGKKHYLHRLAWLYVYGDLPKHVDHINGDKSDNRIENLRPATKAQNGFNRGKNANNSSGFKGVWKDKNKWSAGIWVAGSKIYLGNFDTREQAHMAYRAAAELHHGEFARVS